MKVKCMINKKASIVSLILPLDITDEESSYD